MLLVAGSWAIIALTLLVFTKFLVMRHVNTLKRVDWREIASAGATFAVQAFKSARSGFGIGQAETSSESEDNQYLTAEALRSLKSPLSCFKGGITHEELVRRTMHFRQDHAGRRRKTVRFASPLVRCDSPEP